jgi:hypothetical protein
LDDRRWNLRKADGLEQNTRGGALRAMGASFDKDVVTCQEALICNILALLRVSGFRSISIKAINCTGGPECSFLCPPDELPASGDTLARFCLSYRLSSPA